MDQTGEYTSNRSKDPSLTYPSLSSPAAPFSSPFRAPIYLAVSTFRFWKFLGLEENSLTLPPGIYIVIRASRGSRRVRCSTQPWSRGVGIPFLIPQVIPFPSSRTRVSQSCRSGNPETPTARLPVREIRTV